MLLILEIVLTVWVWNTGWRWLALLPLGIAFGIGVMIGIFIALNGGNSASLNGVWVFDLICVGALIWMGVKGKKDKSSLSNSDVPV
jgi:hypothetical protein